ncbi:MAG: thioredoxin family protein [Bacteroidales bacterium]|nr:thioredoxin family protein [Bacteroidales bacterium]
MEPMNINSIANEVAENPAIMLYFFNDNCPPCLALRPKVENLVNEVFPKMKLIFINAAAHPELAAGYSIFGAPTLLVYFDGKEVFRESKYVSVDSMKERIERYYHLIFDTGE